MAQFADVFSPAEFRRSLAAKRQGEQTPLFRLFPCPDFDAKFLQDDKPLLSKEKAPFVSLALLLEAERRLAPVAPPPVPKGRRPGPEHNEHRRLVTELLIELQYQALYDRNATFSVSYKAGTAQMRQVLGGEWGVLPPPAAATYGGASMVRVSPSVGPVRRHRVMVVGKMPGGDEMLFCRNLTGPSGRKLREIVDKTGVDPEDWYVTNVIRWSNPDPKSDDRLPTDWIKTCAPLARLEMELVQPEFVLTLGGEAMKAILQNNTSLEENKFRVINLPYPGGSAKMIASIHSAFVLRKPEKQPDLEKACHGLAQMITGGEAWAKETDQIHLEVRTLEQLNNLADLILQDPQSTAISFDCEWHGLFPGEPGGYMRSVQFSWAHKRAAAVVLHDAGGVPVLWEQRDEVARIMRRFCKSTPTRAVRAIGHNINADIPWLLHMGLDILDEVVPPAYRADPNDETSTTGHELTKHVGGFDTMLAAHAYRENDEFKLELLGVSKLGLHRTDQRLIAWKKAHQAEKKIGAKDLEGYGDVPNDILIGVREQETPYGIVVRDSYAIYDADTTRRLFIKYNGEPNQPGLLDRDELGNNCRVPFWRSMIATMGFGEFHRKGVSVELRRAAMLSELYSTAAERMVQHIRDVAHWPDFNPNSVYHCRELLFGHEVANRRDKQGNLMRASPPDAYLAMVEPYITTGKRPKLWCEVVQDGTEANYAPSTGKEVLMVLAKQHPLVRALRGVRVLSQVTKFVMRPPDNPMTVSDDGVESEETPDDEEFEFSKGMMSYVLKSDGRVHGQFAQTKETGRASSFEPPLQNLSKSAESVYEDLYRKYPEVIRRPYMFPIRSVVKARPGYKLVDADWTGAELAIAAWQSTDANMIEHVARAQLPEDHPDYYDIHSAVAVRSFKLGCAPTKKGLESIGKKTIRTAAKACVFGTMYGQQAAALARKARQEGTEITEDEAQTLIDGLFEMYPNLPKYFAECRRRSRDPRFLVNCFGRFRRFEQTDDKKTAGEFERQAMNFPIQSAVADAMNMALHELFWYRYQFGRPNTHWYDLVLQVHDAVVLEVPNHCIDWVVDEVLPTCMSKRVAIWPCGLDGVRKPGFDKPFHLQAPPPDVFDTWSIGLKRSECLAEGIGERYALRCDRCSKSVSTNSDLFFPVGICKACQMAEAEKGSLAC